MKRRLFACVALAIVVAGAMAWSSRIARAQAGSAGQDQQSEKGQGQSGEQSADLEKALQAYDQRMDRNLDKCRQELDQMKKELHELIDLRLNMAVSLAELRARHSISGGAFARPGGQGPQGQGAKEPSQADVARELQQIHHQIRSEIDQQQNQVSQLVGQLRAMKMQGQQGQTQQERQPQQGQRPGQEAQGRGQEQGKAQVQQAQGRSQGAAPGERP